MPRKSQLSALIVGLLLTASAHAQATKPPSSDVPVTPNGNCTAIADNTYVSPTAGTTGMACFAITGQNLIITDLNVQVGVDHTWIGDLTMKLVPPSGSPIVTLTNRPGVAGAGFGDSSNLVSSATLTFDDEASDNPETMGNTIGDAQFVCQDDARCTYITNADAEAAGTLAAFDGSNASGTWQFCVGDSAAADTGQICSATLQITGTAPSADLSINITNNFTPPGSVGSQFQYNVTVANAGPGAASGVAATINLSPRVTYVSNTCGATGGATVNWAIGALANGANASCSITVQIASTGTITTTGTVTGNEADPTPANNADTDVATGVAAPILSVPTFGTKALAALVLFLAGLGMVAMRRRTA
jgi:uncharacterized repeat protein (TIGR01451 family)